MISPQAFVHPEAKISANVTIEPFAVIERNVEIGEGTWIGSHVTIMEHCKIGKKCRIFQGAVLSGIPQDLKYGGELTKTIIGDNVTIREYVTVNRGTKDKNHTAIGDNTLIMAYSHIAHDCEIGKNCVLANNATLAGHIKIHDWVIIGGMSAILQFVTIGEHAFLSGGSLVGKDVPPYVKAAREPLSYAGVNSIGLRRRGFSWEDIHHIQDVYRYLFVKGYNTSQALDIIEADVPATQYRDEILNFVRNSSKGIVKRFYQRNDSRSSIGR